MSAKSGILNLLAALAMLVPAVLGIASPAYAGEPPPPVVTTVSYDIVTVDSGEFGGYWAYDYLHSEATITELDEGLYGVFVWQTGYFVSWAGTSPGNTGTIGEGVEGDVEGGFYAIVEGELKEDLEGYLGSFDYGCDQNADCPDYVSWRDLFFEDYGEWGYEWWGWFYTTCGNGYWFNTAEGNEGDITGDFVACPEPEAAPKPVVTGLWAYVNPGAEVGARNICYILSLTRPTQSEADNDVKRLCFTEVAPDWWQGAALMTHGDVFENGTDWGYWEGDAKASAFSGAKRLPLHDEGPNNDLLDKAEKFPWTQSS